MAKTIDEKGIKFIAQWEGLALKAYRCPAGILTCGYGHTKCVSPSTTCTPEVALQWLEEDVQDAVNAVNRLTQVPLTQGQFNALVSFVFNLGWKRYEESTLRHLLNKGDYDGAAGQFGRWVNAGGRKLEGLVKRRKAEMDMFLSGC